MDKQIWYLACVARGFAFKTASYGTAIPFLASVKAQ